jgi:hypothetical protein
MNQVRNNIHEGSWKKDAVDQESKERRNTAKNRKKEVNDSEMNRRK